MDLFEEANVSERREADRVPPPESIDRLSRSSFGGPRRWGAGEGSTGRRSTTDGRGWWTSEAVTLREEVWTRLQHQSGHGCDPGRNAGRQAGRRII